MKNLMAIESLEGSILQTVLTYVREHKDEVIPHLLTELWEQLVVSYGNRVTHPQFLDYCNLVVQPSVYFVVKLANEDTVFLYNVNLLIDNEEHILSLGDLKSTMDMVSSYTDYYGGVKNTYASKIMYSQLYKRNEHNNNKIIEAFLAVNNTRIAPSEAKRIIVHFDKDDKCSGSIWYMSQLRTRFKITEFLTLNTVSIKGQVSSIDIHYKSFIYFNQYNTTASVDLAY